MTVMEPPSKSIVLKSVDGRLLQREESYTEMFPDCPDSDEEQAEDDNDNDNGNGNDGDEDVVLYLKPKSSDVYNFKAPSPTKPFVPSRNVSPALQRNVRAWCEATGLPATVTLRFQDRICHVHKFPLVSRSGYFRKVLKDTQDVTMASDLPVEPEIFELAINFCYGSTILMEPTNIAEIFCAAAYLQMSEDYGRANLCERSELYLNQVALQSWDDTLIVLLHSENLAPHAENLGVVKRCLDAMAFMACMEILDPVARKAVPNRAGELQCWNMRESAYLLWWIEDLVALPPGLFVKVVLALRREGMHENYVGQVVTAFADKWIFGAGVESVMVQKGGDKCWVVESQARPELAALVECVVRVLPLERHVVPVGFLFGLLRRALTCALREDCRIQVETQIALQFEHATLHDLLLPTKESNGSSVFRHELDSMERILMLFLTRFRGYDDARVSDIPMLSGVAKLWDEYLAEIAVDSSVTPARFADLVERIPAYMRVVHDHVYRAIHTYLKSHPTTSQEHRSLVCRSLNCQKLSQEACGHAVQNDLMPLRLIVQAMFMQQLQTRSVLTSHIESASQSFREQQQQQQQLQRPQLPSTNAIHHSRSLLPESTSSFYYPSAGHSARHQFGQDPFQSVGSSFRDNDLLIDDLMYAASSQNKAEIKLPMVVAPPKPEYVVTESRLRSLEAELSRMRKALAHSKHPTSASTSESPPPRPHPSTRPRPKAFPVEEEGVSNCGPTGCLAHLQPVNRTGGLLAKTLQKLRFRGFGKLKAGRGAKSGRQREPVISAPIVESVDRGLWRGAMPVQAGDGRARLEASERVGRRLGRTDSMPRPFTSRVKPRHHVRHQSVS